MPTRFIANFVVLLLACTFFSGCTRAFKSKRIQARADQYFASGEYEKAKVEYLNLLRVQSQSPRAIQQIGLIWMKQGAPLRALPFLNKSREIAPQSVESRLELARAFMATGNPEEARKEALVVVQREPANSQAILILAEASTTKDEIKETDDLIEKTPNKNSAEFHLAKSKLAAAAGDKSAEADELQQAVKADPKSPRAHLYLGYAYQLRGNPDRAGQELKTAAELAPPRSEEKIRYAEFEAATNHLDEAETELKQIAKETPDYLPVWQDLAKLAITAGNYDQALSYLENLFSRNPEDPDGRLLEAQIWLAKGDTAKAIAMTEQLNGKYANNPLVKYTLARMYVANNNLPQAESELQQAIAIKSDYAEAVLLLADVAVRSGNVQSVVTPLEQLVKLRPDLPQARLTLANVYRKLGRGDDAIATFREQTQSAPDSADAFFSYGAMLRQQKKYDEARQAFEKASELAPDRLQPVDQLLGMDLEEQRYDAAAQLVQQQLQKHPNTAGAYFLEGELYFAAGPQQDFNRAEASIKKAIELNPNFSVGYQALVSLYIAQKKLPEAIKELKAESDKNPKNTRPILLGALLLEQTGDHNGARVAYQKALAIDPKSILALNNLAYLDAERFGQLDEAYDLAQKARGLDTNNEKVADTLSWILYKRGQYQQALPLAIESASKSPDNPVVQFHLGMINYMMGDLDKARPPLEKAVASKIQFAEKAEAQRTLDSLQGMASGKTVQSIEQLEKGIQQRPTDVVALLQLGDAYLNKQQYDKAAAAYEQVIKLNPKLPAAYLKLAQLYSGPLGKREQAFDLAKKVRELSPNDPDAAAAVGHLALQAGNYDWAYSTLKESERKGSKSPALLYDLAMAAYATGKVPESRDLMQRYLNSAPAQAEATNAKQFVAFIAAADSPTAAAAAEPEVKSRLATESDYVPALMVRAAIERAQSDQKSAANTYLEVLRKYPDFAPAQKSLAAIYKDDPEKLSDAYQLAMKARKTLPDDPELARTLAEISFKRKEFAYAAQLFEQSARGTSLGAKDWYYLGMAQLQSRQDAKGREALQKALDAGLEDPLATDVRRRLGGRKANP